jgi:predicted GNAT superfamily acetyltransferase
MTIQIRPIRTQDEYRAVEQLQRQVWGLDDVEIVPAHLLLTAQKNGGLVLGAFAISPRGESEQLVGFVFGFAGLSPDGRLKHCSHMTGVALAYQNQNLGYRLKLAQREHVLAQGIDLITWTFDPLESRNASLNFHKLGATCRTYLQDFYGNMRDALNVGLPSDRFQVDWHVASNHVADRLRGDQACPSLSALQADGVPLLNRPLPDDPPRPSQTHFPIQAGRLLIQIPAYFQAIKAGNIELARAWRLHIRTLFEAAFARRYAVTDLLFEEGQSCYLLEKDWTPS